MGANSAGTKKKKTSSKYALYRLAKPNVASGSHRDAVYIHKMTANSCEDLNCKGTFNEALFGDLYGDQGAGEYSCPLWIVASNIRSVIIVHQPDNLGATHTS